MNKNSLRSISNLQFLIVEDSTTSAMLIRQQLISLGSDYDRIVIVERYQDAVKIIESHKFDILIVDYHLEQYLTGYELAMLLYRNRLITDSCGVLFVSGDSSQETVLTALSGKVRHYITKPIATNNLKNKILTICSENNAIAQFNHYLKSHSNATASLFLDQVTHSGHVITLESILIDFLMSRESWQILQEYLNLSQTTMNTAKVCALAHLDCINNDWPEAIHRLHAFIDENPLCQKAMDCLAMTYSEANQTSNAQFWAMKVFELTPSIGDRALRASQYTAQRREAEKLIKIGSSYANHLSVVDSHWFSFITHHFYDVEYVYLNTQNIAAKTALVNHVNTFVVIASKKLLGKRVTSLHALKQLFQCHILIHEGNDELAHKKLLAGLSPYYDELFTCPTTLLTEFLPALLYFGELEIYRCLVAVIATRNHSFNPHYLPKRLFRLETDDESQDFSPFSLENTLLDVNEYQTMIKRHPHASESKIKYLHSTYVQQQGDRNTIVRYLTELDTLDLPPLWQHWVILAKQHKFSTPPPAPFILTKERSTS
ncbi:response regulator [Vibrio sinensis]|uniref:response regulator n=1 Tax=Vibrio sinensis TaxID=2302434 RepID=UPI001402FC60|nr:response regulator [Vibrio sinensis]